MMWSIIFLCDRSEKNGFSDKYRLKFFVIWLGENELNSLLEIIIMTLKLG